MKVWSDEIQNEIINKLRTEFKTWQNVVAADESLNCVETSSSSAPSFMRKIFNHDQSQINHEVEIDNYLNETISFT